MSLRNTDLNAYISSLDDKIFMHNHLIDAQFRFILTQTCNEQCFFCHNEWLPVVRNFMDFMLFSNIIDAIKALNYKQRVRLTWWEPLLHKNAINFSRYAKEKLPDSNVWMTTNWLLIKKQLSEILTSGLDVITVSVHSMVPERYEQITKVNWLHVVLEWLALLKARWFQWKIKINTVVDQKNIDELPFFHQFTSEHGFELKILDVLTHDYKDFRQHIWDHMSIHHIREVIGTNIVWKVKKDRTQPKCIDCDHQSVCWHEAAYLRITPDWIMNPCLSMKAYDIALWDLKRDNLQKWISLWLRRVSHLDW